MFCQLWLEDAAPVADFEQARKPFLRQEGQDDPEPETGNKAEDRMVVQ
jgi:hypothetical protein